MPETLNVTFRLLSGQGVTLSVPDDMRISEVKALIAAECDVSAGNQRLIFKGQQLSDDSTLGHYDVASGSTVHVVGGAQSGSGTNQQQQQTQSTQSNTRPAFNFGEAMASSMNMLMREMMSPQGGNAGTTGPFSGSFTVPPTQGSSGSSNNGAQSGMPNFNWPGGAEGADRLIMQGMQFAQQLGQSNGDFGAVASRIFSGVMGGFMNPTGRPNENGPAAETAGNTAAPTPKQQPQPTTTPETHADRQNASSSRDSNKSTDQSTPSALSRARDSINRVCSLHGVSNTGVEKEAAGGVDGSSKAAQTVANDSLTANLKAILALTRTSSGVFLTDSQGLDTKLPWEFLQLLEKELHSFQGTDAHEKAMGDVDDFMRRYRDAQNRVTAVVNEMADWSKRSHQIDATRFSKLSAICSLQAALHSELALITAVLATNASQLDPASEGGKERNASSGAAQANSREHSGGTSALDATQRTAGGGSGSSPKSSSGAEPTASTVGKMRYDSATTASRPDSNTRVASSVPQQSSNTAASGVAFPAGGSHLGSMLSNLGRLAESAMKHMHQQPAASTVATSNTNDDVLPSSTWLRRQFNDYRNSPGFKARMDELAQKTKKLGTIYCTGVLPK
ncbi:ubiquitin family domain containing protein [Babesia caballi]|uniref:Ubiquitin family domain containing protein n=1 Tax=Babesia caballi TaxID=5871 RepID=A0AAV4LYQ2_BABCB|nr:ubiquitin family domain containing protein [Babesia caballi]